MAKRGPSQLNLLIAVDKPAGITSHDVVSRARRALRERRVGHAGTLDPAATGVVILGVGQATRLLGMLTLDTKSYVARIAFGTQTNTDDGEGEIVGQAPVPPQAEDHAWASAVLERFLGEQMQVPPAFSAISVDGVRSYKRAREGERVELPARAVNVLAAQLLAVEPSRDGVPLTWTVAFTVSKGTYIRALARDIGRSIGSAAHLSELRRTSSGCVTLADCLSLDEMSVQRAQEAAIDPVRALGCPSLVLDDAQAAYVANGRALDVPEGASGRVALLHGGGLIAVARQEGRRLVMEQVFPQPITGVHGCPR